MQWSTAVRQPLEESRPLLQDLGLQVSGTGLSVYLDAADTNAAQLKF